MNSVKWPQHVEKNLFLYKDHFFQVPYLYNSPQKMIAGLEILPITEHITKKNTLTIGSVLYKAHIVYRKLDEDFWILSTHMTMKENIITVSSYDETNFKDYYFLHYSVVKQKFYTSPSTYVMVDSATWCFTKPNTKLPSYFYKKSQFQTLTFAFRKDWIRKNLTYKEIKQRKALIAFLNGKKGFTKWPDLVPDANHLAKQLTAILEDENTTAGSYTSILRKKSMHMIIQFFENAFTDNRIQDNVSLNNNSYTAVIMAEKILTQNLHLPFKGIESIAREVNIAPTQLKSWFKIVYGRSMLQYCKEKNLILALQLLKKSKVDIKDISIFTGYSSASRFAATFKKRFNILPSKARQLSQ